MMFEIEKIFSETKYMNKAFERLFLQFPHLKGTDANPFYGPWEIKCFEGAGKPYVVVINVIQNDRLVRNEWYEYYKGKWNYVGYWTREDCISYLREKSWKKNEHCFKNRQEFIQFERDNGYYTPDEEVARMLPDDYFTEYHYFGLKKQQ